MVHLSNNHIIIIISENNCAEQCSSLEFSGTKFSRLEIKQLCLHLCGRENSKIEPGDITPNDVNAFEFLSGNERRQTGGGSLLRKEYRLLSADERQRFVNAIWTLRGSRTYEIFHFLHHYQNAPGAHRGAAFLVWHREFISR